MALEDLTPAVRTEEILDGADIEPATRLEYFMKKAANEVPKPAGSSDAGKVVTVNEDGDGFELSDVDPGLPEISGVSDAGKVVSVNSAGSSYELTTPSSGGVDVIEMPQAMESELQGIIANAGTAAAASGNDFGTDAITNATPAFKSALFDAVKDYATLGKMFCLRAVTDIGPAWVPDYAVWNDTSPMHCEITIRWNVQLISSMCFIAYVTLRLEGGATGTLSADHLVVKY